MGIFKRWLRFGLQSAYGGGRSGAVASLSPTRKANQVPQGGSDKMAASTFTSATVVRHLVYILFYQFLQPFLSSSILTINLSPNSNKIVTHLIFFCLHAFNSLQTTVKSTPWPLQDSRWWWRKQHQKREAGTNVGETGRDGIEDQHTWPLLHPCPPQDQHNGCPPGPD